jgi:hypothetical protein
MFTTAPAFATTPAQLTLAAGVFEILSDRQHAFEGDLTYRFGQSVFDSGGVLRGIHPELGVLANSRGAVMGWAGLVAPLQFNRWEIAPSVGAGAYHRGQSKYLGGAFEFHLGLDVSYALSLGSRIGLAFRHISNGGLHDKNPGENAALATWTWMFRH